MSTLQQRGEKVKKAIQWISESRQENENRPLYGLIEEAGMRFNLSPKEQEFLVSFYRENPEGED